ncbi:MAG: response regulator [Gammaproteobacteria bacterium]|nr:response regulator [Gammaproteobacteria bacterium]
MSILVIDSTTGILPRLKAIFEDRGLTNLALAKTAAEARALHDEKAKSTNSIDEMTLIIIDGKLDDGDGFELCRQIRDMPAAAHAYIIVLVSSAENKTAIEKAKHSGANDYAVKPYDGIEFIRHFMVYAYRKTVLLVEDDPVIVKLISALVHKKHLELITAGDGTRGYNLINTISPPRLVLLDIGLPGMNGIKLVELIRGKNIWRKTPVLMLTGSKEASDVKNSLGAGANDYIVKPFQIDDVNKRIDKFLGEVK